MPLLSRIKLIIADLFSVIFDGTIKEVLDCPELRAVNLAL